MNEFQKNKGSIFDEIQSMTYDQRKTNLKGICEILTGDIWRTSNNTVKGNKMKINPLRRICE